MFMNETETTKMMGVKLYGVEVVIPPKANRVVQREYDKDIYKYRHIVENIFEVLKRWWGIATCYAKHTSSFLAAAQIACAVGYAFKEHSF